MSLRSVSFAPVGRGPDRAWRGRLPADRGRRALFCPAIRYGGAAFLIWYGARNLYSALRSPGRCGGSRRRIHRASQQTLAMCLALTWLNPHVYLDTLMLLGAISTRFPGQESVVRFRSDDRLVPLFLCAWLWRANICGPSSRARRSWRVLEALIAGHDVGDRLEADHGAMRGGTSGAFSRPPSCQSHPWLDDVEPSSDLSPPKADRISASRRQTILAPASCDLRCLPRIAAYEGGAAECSHKDAPSPRVAVKIDTRREPCPPPRSKWWETNQPPSHCRDRPGRAPVDPPCLGGHCRLSDCGRPRRRLRRAPHRHQHRQRQAPVELAPLAPAGNQAQRPVPAADRPDRRGHRRDDARSSGRSGGCAGHALALQTKGDSRRQPA